LDLNSKINQIVTFKYFIKDIIPMTSLNWNCKLWWMLLQRLLQEMQDKLWHSWWYSQ
jgi:hypothetical protein